MRADLLLSDEELSELSPGQLAEYHAILEEERLANAHLAWRERARPEQLPPEGDWQTLFLRGGRGSGKGWAASHILAELIATDPLRDTEGPGQWAIVAPTYGAARDVCVESESGLLAALGTSAQESPRGRARASRCGTGAWERSDCAMGRSSSSTAPMTAPFECKSAICAVVGWTRRRCGSSGSVRLTSRSPTRCARAPRA